MLARIVAHPVIHTFGHELETVDKSRLWTVARVFSSSCIAIYMCRGRRRCVFLSCRTCVLMF